MKNFENTNIDKRICICGNTEFESILMNVGFNRVEIQNNVGGIPDDFEVKICTKCGSVKFIKNKLISHSRKIEDED